MTLLMRDQENLDRGIAIGEKRGEKRGREEGEKIGREAGEKIGRKAGKKAEKIQIAKTMLEKGFDKNIVIEITGLPVEEIERL